MKPSPKFRTKQTTMDWDGQPVRVDLLPAPRRRREASASASVMHAGPKPTAVIDLSLSTKRPARLRELADWLNRVADHLSGVH